MIQGATMGALTVVIGGDVSDLDKAAKQAEGIVGRLSSKIGGPGVTQLATYAAAATAAGAALVVGLTAKAWQTIDAQADLAHRIGGTVAEIQELAFAAKLGGVSMEELSQSVGKMNVKLAEAARTGQGPAYEALKRLGLSAKDFLDLPVNERLATLADRYNDLGYSTAQQAASLRQLGIRSQEFINVFEGGGDAIRQAKKDVEDFGVKVSDLDAGKIQAANDAWDTALLLLTGIGNQIAVRIAPIVKVVADRFAAAGREAHGFSDAIEQGVRMGVIGFGRLNTVVYQTRVELDEMAADLIGVFNAVAGAIPKGISAATGGLVSAAQLGYKDIEHSFGNLRATLEKPPSDEGWIKWYDDAVAKAKEAAEQILADRAAAKKNPPPPPDEDQRKQLQDRLDQLRKSLASEDEALRLQRDEELKKLAEFEAKRAVTAEEAAALRLQIQDKYAKASQELFQSKFEEGVLAEDELLARKYEKQLADLAEFEKSRTDMAARAAEVRRKLEQKYAMDVQQLHARQYSALAGIVDTSMGQISDLVDQEGNKQFGIFKAISSATALVKGYEAAVSAYAAGNATGIPGMGAAMAAASALGTAAYIAKLNAVSVGGAGGASVSAPAGGGGSAPAAAAQTQPAGPQQTMFVTFQGSFWNRDSVRDLAGKLLEFQADGGKVVLQ